MSSGIALVWRCFLTRVETLQALGSYAVYVYSSHERSTLRCLARAYGGSRALDHWSDPTGSHALRDRVLSYNEDDVPASFVVRDWLKAIASGEVRRES